MRRWQSLLCLLCLWFAAPASQAIAQAPADATDQQMERLSAALTRTEAQLSATQQELESLRSQLDQLRRQLLPESAGAGSAPNDTLSSNRAQDEEIARRLQDVEERQQQQEAQIATHQQAKVESASKYPVHITGMILLNSFVNTGNVDNPATPAFALDGSGSTGLSLRQTILGLDAQGPHVFGGQTSADFRTDFSGAASSTSYSGGLNLLRLRTAHANINWAHTAAFFSLDRTLLNPNSPTSLTAVAQPALAWSGNLWDWNPQFGITHDATLSDTARVRLQGALIDPSDPPAFTTSLAAQSTLPSASAAERSRWPGLEARLAYVHRGAKADNEIGVGGYVSPHRLPGGHQGESWAGTIDYRLALPARLEWSGNAYRGQGLGGLGGGAYKDYVVRLKGGQVDLQFLDDAGGWTQLKQRTTQRLEWNAAFGIDNAFSSQLRPYIPDGASTYLALARNRTFIGNVIYSPSSYLLFSLEYRSIRSSPVSLAGSTANVIGAAAGYRF